jgi:hypothetical protein
LAQTALALTDAQADGVNDELVASYINYAGTLNPADSNIPVTMYKQFGLATAAYLGCDWLAAFDCEPSYCFMKGLNSEGTPKVVQFGVTMNAAEPVQIELANYPSQDVTSWSQPASASGQTDNGTAFLTILYDTILGLTFNSAGYRTSSFEGLTTGALYSPPSPYAGAGMGVAPGNPT